MVVSPDLLGPLCGRLTALELDAASKSHESASTSLYAIGLEGLTALRQLTLSGPAVELHQSGLPPGLTELKLQGYRDLTSSNRHSLPRQVRQSRVAGRPACVGRRALLLGAPAAAGDTDRTSRLPDAPRSRCVHRCSWRL